MLSSFSIKKGSEKTKTAVLLSFRGHAIQPGRHWSLRLNGVKTALDAARDGTGVSEIDEPIQSPESDNEEPKPFKEVAVDVGNLLSQHQQKPVSFNAPIPSSKWSPSQNYATLRRPVARNNSAIGLVNNGSSSLTDNEFIIPKHRSGINLQNDEPEDHLKGTFLYFVSSKYFLSSFCTNNSANDA